MSGLICLLNIKTVLSSDSIHRRTMSSRMLKKYHLENLKRQNRPFYKNLINKEKTKPSKIRIRGLSGSVSTDKISSSTTSVYLIWDGWGIGQSSFKYKSNSNNNIYDLSNQSTNLSYTFGGDWNVTLGLSSVSQGKGKVTSSNKEYSTESGSGSGYFWTFGMELWGIEFLGGYRKNSFVFKEFNKTNTDGTTTNLNADLPISGGQMMFGLGIKF